MNIQLIQHFGIYFIFLGGLGFLVCSMLKIRELQYKLKELREASSDLIFTQFNEIAKLKGKIQ